MCVKPRRGLFNRYYTFFGTQVNNDDGNRPVYTIICIERKKFHHFDYNHHHYPIVKKYRDKASCHTIHIENTSTLWIFPIIFWDYTFLLLFFRDLCYVQLWQNKTTEDTRRQTWKYIKSIVYRCLCLYIRKYMSECVYKTRNTYVWIFAK